MFYSIATVSFLGAEHGSLRGGFSPDSSLRSALRSQRAEEVERAPRLALPSLGLRAGTRPHRQDRGERPANS